MSTEQATVATALPDYDIGGELGRGAWGIVLAGRHRHLGRDVAIKRLPPSFAHDPATRARFVGEARLLSTLDHPHIVPVYDYIERDGLCLLVMEQLSGGTVWDRFAGQGIAPAVSCGIALVTAVALDHAHSRGVLHRDIKPENLLFSADGAGLKVADFGIAKVLTGARTALTSAGQVLGTPSYMAPEQARGEPATPAADVYALGSTLYRLLSGRLPFPPVDSAVAALYQRVHEQPTPLVDAAPGVPSQLASVVMRSVATEPSERPPSAAAFAVALAGAATDVLGPGWVDSCGIRATLGGRVAAITEGAGAASASLDGIRVRPAAAAPATAAASEATTPATDATVAASAATRPARRPADDADTGPATDGPAAALRARIAGSALPEEERAAALRLLGGRGTPVEVRLGLTLGAGRDEVRQRILVEVERWRRRAEHPMTPRAAATLAQELVRVCEGLLADQAR